ncbi:hypothetical protein D1007_23179 [Hordeum vulgare]|nr:hypothetical protein D1007_23179 [Hordeum vulgare]
MLHTCITLAVSVLVEHNQVHYMRRSCNASSPALQWSFTCSSNGASAAASMKRHRWPGAATWPKVLLWRALCGDGCSDGASLFQGLADGTPQLRRCCLEVLGEHRRCCNGATPNHRKHSRRFNEASLELQRSFTGCTSAALELCRCCNGASPDFIDAALELYRTMVMHHESWSGAFAKTHSCIEPTVRLTVVVALL